MFKGSNSPFRVPKRDLLPKPGESGGAEAIRAWVEELPTANVGHTARELYLKLKWLNRLDIPPAARLQALSHMQPVLLFVLDALAAHYARERLPLSERNRLIAELARDLMTRMVVGYKIAFRQYLEKGPSLVDRLIHSKAKAEALYGVLYYLSRLLLQSYRLYQDIPPYTWQEIHATYHWAEECGQQFKGLHNDVLSPGKKTTVSELYKQILLLSLAGPYRMFQGEVEKTYAALKGWTGKCKLIPFGEAVSAEVKFAVFRTLDAPPAFRERLGQQEGLQGWYLDTQKLSAMLSQQLGDSLDSNKTPAKKAVRLQSSSELVSDELKRRLMLSWGVGFKRHDKRARDAGKVQVAVGLESVFALMGGVGETLITDVGIGVKEVSDLSPEEEAQLQSGSLLSKAEWQLSEGNIDVMRDALADRDERLQRRLKRVSDVCVEVSEVLDKSVHGYHFVWSGKHQTTPQVGELVGVSDSVDFADEAAWQIGVIRWLRDVGEAQLEFGVEIVAKEAAPVMLWYLPHDSDLREEWCSLLVQLPGDGKAVIAPTFYPHERDQLFLVQEEDERPIQFTQLMEYTGYFSKYRFELLADQAAEKESEEDSFSSLWHDL